MRRILSDYLDNVHFSPTDRLVLATLDAELRMLHGGSNVIRLWDVNSLLDVDVHFNYIIKTINGCGFSAFSPDGRTIATAGVNRAELHLVDVESTEQREMAFAMGQHPRLRAGSQVLALEPGVVEIILDPVFCRMVGHEDSVSSATFSVDGSKLASGSHDGTCKVWDSSTGALLHTIELGSPVSPVLSVSSGRDWVKVVAFAMGLHSRLGAGSQVLELDVGVVRMILDRV